MKITVLVDNKAKDTSGLKAEHGFSLWVETDDAKNILIDVGATSIFIENASALGINIADADYLILSHAHADHVGGLAAFMQINNKAKIYLSSQICGLNCYSTRSGVKRNISIDHSLLQQHKERFIFIDESMKITDNILLLSKIPVIHPVPMANATLLANDACDDFSHELAVLLSADNDTATIISPCSHRGILNILDAAGGSNITNFIGGMHLLDSDEKCCFESVDEIKSLAREISKRDIRLFTGHCTGNVAKDIFSKELKEKFTELYSGLTINV